MLNRVTIKPLKESGFLGAGRFFLGIFLFCFPFQVRSLVYSGDFFLTGNFNPYTTFFFHLTDLFLLLALAAWGAAVWRGETELRLAEGQRKLTLVVLLFVLAAVLMVFISADKVLAFFMALRLLLFFILYLMVAGGMMARGEVIRYFLGGMVFQAMLVFAQYLLQNSAGFGFLGEPLISPSLPGVAKIDIEGAKLMRAYGTFAHPNVLGGTMAIAMMFCFLQTRKRLWVSVALMAVFALALVFSFSRSAFFALGASFLVYISINEGKLALRHVALAFSVLLFFIVALNLEGLFTQRFLFSDAESGLARIRYMEISKDMLMEHPFGVGMGGFTSVMQDFTVQKLEPWLHQPVHNVFLLGLNEMGLPGGILLAALPVMAFYLLIKKVVRKDQEGMDSQEKQFGHILIAVLAGLVTVSLFDHYLFTIYAGQALFFIYLGLVGSYLKNEGLPRRNS